MSIIDPRKGNEIRRGEMYKILLLQSHANPPKALPRTIDHIQLASAIQPEITPFRPTLSEAKEKRLSSHHS